MREDHTHTLSLSLRSFQNGQQREGELMNPILPVDYQRLLADIKQRVRSAQYEALKAVNKELIVLYWDIGRMIVERQKGDSWGKSVVEKLAGDLRVEFPGMGG